MRGGCSSESTPPRGIRPPGRACGSQPDGRAQAASRMPAGVRAAPALTTACSRLAAISSRDSLARSIRAVAASLALSLPLARSAITARASRARSSGVSIAPSNSPNGPSAASGSSAAKASQRRSSAGERSFGKSACRERSSSGSSSQPTSWSRRSTAASPTTRRQADPGPAAQRGAHAASLDAWVRKARARLSSDGPPWTPQQRFALRPEPQGQGALRPTFATDRILARAPVGSRAVTRRTYGRLY